MAAPTALQRSLSIFLSLLLVFATTPFRAVAQEAPSPEANSYSGEGEPLSAEELQALVAPIALYPDALVAQVLGAATFPDQIADAASRVSSGPVVVGNRIGSAGATVHRGTRFDWTNDSLATRRVRHVLLDS